MFLTECHLTAKSGVHFHLWLLIFIIYHHLAEVVFMKKFGFGMIILTKMKKTVNHLNHTA